MNSEQSLLFFAGLKSRVNEAHGRLLQLPKIGHFGAMQTTQLAALVGVTPASNHHFATVSEQENFGPTKSLMQYSESLQSVLSSEPPTDAAGKKVSKSKWNAACVQSSFRNVMESLKRAGHNFKAVVLENLGCVVTRIEAKTKSSGSNKEGDNRCSDLIFTDRSGCVQNFFRMSKQGKHVEYLSSGHWRKFSEIVEQLLPTDVDTMLVKVKFLSKHPQRTHPFGDDKLQSCAAQ